MRTGRSEACIEDVDYTQASCDDCGVMMLPAPSPLFGNREFFREEIGNAVDRVIGDAAEHMAQAGPGIMAAQGALAKGWRVEQAFCISIVLVYLPRTS